MSSSTGGEERISSESGTERKSKEGHHVILISKNNRYRLNVHRLTSCSLKMRRLKKDGKLPKTVDATLFENDAVKALYEYIEHRSDWDNGQDFKLSFFALSDLMYLARTLQMKKMLRQLSENVEKIARSTTENLIQSLIVVGSERFISAGMGVRRRVETIAAAQFPSLVKHKQFCLIPTITFASILSRCDLNVRSEMEVVDAALIWLWRQKDPLTASAFAMSAIRSAFLSPSDRETIREAILLFSGGDQLVGVIMTILTNSNSRRCCFIRQHIERNYVRCGVPTECKDTAKVDLDKLPMCKALRSREKPKIRKRRKSKSDDTSGSTSSKCRDKSSKKCSRHSKKSHCSSKHSRERKHKKGSNTQLKYAVNGAKTYSRVKDAYSLYKGLYTVRKQGGRKERSDEYKEGNKRVTAEQS